MLRPRFFTAEPLAEGISLSLEKEPSRHIAKALRMRVGDRLALFDGRGCEVAAQIVGIDRDAVRVATETMQRVDRESPLRITLAIALARGDRVDTTVQKATELGVHAIWPFFSERSGVRLPADRLDKKREHWQRIAISACEQCGRNTVPEIAPSVDFATLLTQASNTPVDARLILHPDAAATVAPASCQSLILFIGPEGGFSDNEVAAAVAAGFQALQLGPRILRTETAPLAAIAVAQSRWGDLLNA